MNENDASKIITKFFKNVHCCLVDFDCIPFKKILFTNHGTYNIDNLIRWSNNCIQKKKLASYPCTREYIKPSILFIMLIRSGLPYLDIQRIFFDIQHIYKEINYNPVFESLKNFILSNPLKLKSFLNILIHDQINFHSKTITQDQKYILGDIIIQAMSVQYQEIFLILNYTS